MMTPKIDEPAHWDEIRRTIGANIRELRLAAQLSQEDFAEKTGISRNTIVRIEWGRTSLTIEHLVDIAEALKTAPSTLLERTPQSLDFEPLQWSGGRSSIRTNPQGFTPPENHNR